MGAPSAVRAVVRAQSVGNAMADGHIPDDLREFILQHIDSITQLEALLLLRANAAEAWDVAKATRRRRR